MLFCYEFTNIHDLLTKGGWNITPPLIERVYVKGINPEVVFPNALKAKKGARLYKKPGEGRIRALRQGEILTKLSEKGVWFLVKTLKGEKGWVKKSLVEGETGVSINMEKPITKADLAVIVSRIMDFFPEKGLIEGKPKKIRDIGAALYEIEGVYRSKIPRFTDKSLQPLNPAFGYVEETVLHFGLMNGSVVKDWKVSKDNLYKEFNPDRIVKREEFLVVLLQLISRTRSVGVASVWLEDHPQVAKLVAQQFPDRYPDNITLEDIACVLNKILTEFRDVSIPPSSYPGYIYLLDDILYEPDPCDPDNLARPLFVFPFAKTDYYKGAWSYRRLLVNGQEPAPFWWVMGLIAKTFVGGPTKNVTVKMVDNKPVSQYIRKAYVTNQNKEVVEKVPYIVLYDQWDLEGTVEEISKNSVKVKPAEGSSVEIKVHPEAYVYISQRMRTIKERVGIKGTVLSLEGNWAMVKNGNVTYMVDLSKVKEAPSISVGAELYISGILYKPPKVYFKFYKGKHLTKEKLQKMVMGQKIRVYYMRKKTPIPLGQLEREPTGEDKILKEDGLPLAGFIEIGEDTTWFGAMPEYRGKSILEAVTIKVEKPAQPAQTATETAAQLTSEIQKAPAQTPQPQPAKPGPESAEQPASAKQAQGSKSE